MEALIECMEQVGNSPYDVHLYPRYIKLAGEQDNAARNESNDDGDGVSDHEESDELGPLGTEACSTMTSAMAATSDVWLPLLKYQRSTLDALNKPEDAKTLLDLFSASRNDYLSIPVLKFQVVTLINLNTRQKENNMADESPNLWADEDVRDILKEIASMASSHISKSHEIWDLWAKWELGILEALSSSAGNNQKKKAEKAEAITRIDEMFLARLRQPHSNYNSTSELYSPFVSSYFPDDEYEVRLVAATKARELPLKQLSWREGNPKRVREHLELRALSGSLMEWKQYLTWELKAKKPQRKFIMPVYERAVECAARERWDALCQARDAPNDEAVSVVLKTKDDNLKEMWGEYLVYASQENNGDPRQLLSLARRAARSVPDSGGTWALYMQFVERATRPTNAMEQFEWEETIEDIYGRMLQANLVQKSVEDFVVATLTRASWSRRLCFIEEEGETVIDQDRMADVIQVVEEGIATVRKLEGGDAKMRLEGFLSTFYLALPLPDNALEVLQSAAKFYRTSYLAWLNYADLLVSQNNTTEARRVFKDASQRKGLDWAEAIWERWTLFEYQFGTLEEITKTLSMVKEFKKVEDARRKKAWEAHAQAQAAARAANGMAPNGTIQPFAPSAVPAVVAPETSMDVDIQPKDAGERSLKRKRSIEEIVESSPTAKKSKYGESTASFPAMKTVPAAQPNSEKPALKRDRERTTVLVSTLPQSAVDDDLHKLFKDCGEIREISIKKLPNELVATVEFMDQESIPGALTKDKKRVQGVEITVSVAWESTLYVTNFRDGMDDVEMRGIFEKFGTILDVRWPSKRIKVTRRFCYVQFTTPAAAQEALILNDFEMDGLKMTVLLSDPTRKKNRSDAGARELRVTGVVKSVTKADLEKLFSPHGTLKDVRLVPAVGNNQTAFVEYEAEESAERGLALNNHMLKGRRLAVTMADSRPGRPGNAAGAREETNSRSIRVKNVPNGTQEAILQQALEKIAPVVRVQLLSDRNEAIVEMTNAADAGRILLEHPSISFNGATLALIEEGRTYSVASRGRGRGTRADRGGRGSGSRAGLGMRSVAKTDVPVTAASTQATNSAPETRTPRSQDDFRKMLGF